MTVPALKPELKAPRLLLAAAALGVCAVPAVFLNSIIGYAPVTALALLYIASLVYSIFLARRIAFSESSEKGSCIRGTDIDFHVEVSNPTVLVCAGAEAVLYASDMLGDTVSEKTVRFTLAPCEPRTFSFTVRFEHIGEYAVGLRQIKVTGLFGAFPIVIESRNEFKVSVAPMSHELGQLSVSSRVNSESPRAYTRSSFESMDYAGVRDYSFGDPIKLIHWKLSSHTGGYMTKLLESYGNNGISVIVDMLSPKYGNDTLMSVYDAVLESSFSLCRYARENGLDSELLYFRHDGRRAVSSPYEIDSFLAAMLDMPPIYTESRPKMDAHLLLTGDGTAAIAHSNVALCTASVGDKTVRGLLDLLRARKNPMLIFVLPDEVYGEDRRTAMKPLRALEAAGIPYFVISSADKIGTEVGRA